MGGRVPWQTMGHHLIIMLHREEVRISLEIIPRELNCLYRLSLLI